MDAVAAVRGVGFAKLNQINVIHLDIKLENMLLYCSRIGRLQIKLADFGSAVLGGKGTRFIQTRYAAQSRNYRAPKVSLVSDYDPFEGRAAG